MGNEAADLIKLAFDQWTLFTAGAIFMLLRMFQATPIGRHHFYRRILPFLPEGLGCIAAFAGGIPVVDGQPIALKVAAGLWCGYAAQRFHKFLGQTLLGDDPKIGAGAAPPQEPGPEPGEDER